MRLRLERWDSPVAILLLVTDESGRLCGLEFEENQRRMQRLLDRYYPGHTLQPGAAPSAIRAALRDYFQGDMEAPATIRTAPIGTAFQQRVWNALREIPAGTTVSYGQLAASIGQPAASRAVGAANGANPIPIVVPCHRVIGSDGSLTGFGSGLPRKQWLLNHEQRFGCVTTSAGLIDFKSR